MLSIMMVCEIKLSNQASCVRCGRVRRKKETKKCFRKNKTQNILILSVALGFSVSFNQFHYVWVRETFTAASIKLLWYWNQMTFFSRDSIFMWAQQIRFLALNLLNIFSKILLIPDSEQIFHSSPRGEYFRG